MDLFCRNIVINKVPMIIHFTTNKMDIFCHNFVINEV